MEAGQNNAAGELFAQLREYVALQTRILRLRAIHQAARRSASGMAIIIFLFLFVAIFSVLTVSAGLYLATLLQSTAKGFLAVGGVYALLLVILVIFREPLLKRPLRNTIIRSLLRS